MFQGCSGGTAECRQVAARGRAHTGTHIQHAGLKHTYVYVLLYCSDLQFNTLSLRRKQLFLAHLSTKC